MPGDREVLRAPIVASSVEHTRPARRERVLAGHDQPAKHQGRATRVKVAREVVRNLHGREGEVDENVEVDGVQRVVVRVELPSAGFVMVLT